MNLSLDNFFMDDLKRKKVIAVNEKRVSLPVEEKKKAKREKKEGFIARRGEKKAYRGKERGFHCPSRRKKGL